MEELRTVLNALTGITPDQPDRGDTQSLHLDADAYLQMNDEEAWNYLQSSIEQQQQAKVKSKRSLKTPGKKQQV